jgi:uncharacterized protein YdhG (YjbR/CyaY superfamily)
MTVIDDYLDKLAQPERDILQGIRVSIKKRVPEAVETISYGMPVFKYKGKYLIGFAAFKNHLSIFPGANPVATTKVKLSDYKLSKGTIQFAIDHQLPNDVLAEIIDECVKNISNR